MIRKQNWMKEEKTELQIFQETIKKEYLDDNPLHLSLPTVDIYYL